MRIAITGASGFVGQPLVARLTEAGHSVLTVGRRRESGPQPDVTWDPAAGSIEGDKLNGVEGVIHLAGENISERWTDEQKRRVRESRVEGTGLIARTVAAMRPRPAVLVSMSAVGIYGDRGDEELDESSSLGTGFQAEVCRVWEASAEPAREAGIRVIHPRTGVVLNRHGGALERMLPFFLAGVGGRVGDGRQWMSWVARTDVVKGLQFLVEHPQISGVVNLTSPEPARNTDFTRHLAAALNRPAFMPVPAFVIGLLYGQMGVETVAQGQRVLPKALLAAGFVFSYPELGSALAHELARDHG